MILDTEEPGEMDKEVMDIKKEECSRKLLEYFESTILRSEVRLASSTACLISVVRFFITLFNSIQTDSRGIIAPSLNEDS